MWSTSPHDRQSYRMPSSPVPKSGRQPFEYINLLYQAAMMGGVLRVTDILHPLPGDQGPRKRRSSIQAIP